MDIDDIPAGSDWHGAIGTALHNCRAIIVVITQKYLGSRYGSNEMYQANSDQKAIFPVFLQDVDFGITETSRGVKYVISGINWTMFRPNIDDYNASLTKLIGGLKGNGKYIRTCMPSFMHIAHILHSMYVYAYACVCMCV